MPVMAFFSKKPETGAKNTKLEIPRPILEIPPPIRVEQEMHESIIGQERAVRELAKLYVKIRSGIRPSSIGPLDSVFLAGPSGVGKTEAVITLAKMLMETAPISPEEADSKYKKEPAESKVTEKEALSKIIKIDGGNFQHGHEVATLLGSPHGYLGFDSSKGLLHPAELPKYEISYKDFKGTERKLIIILLDEAEKGHETLHNVFLTILDKGRLTLGDNAAADLSNSLIFFTSNVGNVSVEKAREHSIGFQKTDVSPEQTFKKEYKGMFKPEYRGRINKTIVFDYLTKEDLNKIVGLKLAKVEDGFRNSGIDLDLQITVAAKEFLIQNGYNLSEGARALKKLVVSNIEEQLILAIEHYDLNGRTVVVDLDEKGGVVFYFGDERGFAATKT